MSLQVLRKATGRLLSRAAVVGLLGAACALYPTPAQAMTVLQLDLKALVASADLVLYGQIASTRVLDRRKEGRGVWTEYTLQVREVWKGDAKLAGKPLAWRHVGGTTEDGMTVAVPGMPTFVPGEETIVVLEQTADSWVVSGGPQGKFTVQVAAGGQRIVSRDIPDVHFVRRDPATGKVEEAPKPVTVLRSLAEMRAEVLGYVADAAKAAKPEPAKSPTAKSPTAKTPAK